MGDAYIMGKNMDAYLDHVDEPGDKGSIEFYAELIARQVNGNAQVTNAVAVAKALPEGIARIDEQETIMPTIHTHQVDDEYTLTLANQSVTMSPTNWMLALIAFLLFLILVLK